MSEVVYCPRCDGTCDDRTLPCPECGATLVVPRPDFPTPLEQYCMVAQANGVSRKRAFLACPDPKVRTYTGFERPWRRVQGWRVNARLTAV